MTVLAPTPTMAPRAALRFMKGNVVARPLMASGPTPCPMKMRSTLLYRLLAVMAMMAGRAYCQSSRPMLFVPSSVGMYCFC